MTTLYPKNNLTREGIITNMCYTWNHSFGAPFQSWQDVFGSEFVTPPGISAGTGMSPEERECLWKQMAQIYDNDIAPYHTLNDKN